MKLTKVWILASVALMLIVRASDAQTATKHPVTDSEKIADALSAGPPFITKDATILDWPATPGGELSAVLRLLAATPAVAHLWPRAHVPQRVQRKLPLDSPPEGQLRCRPGIGSRSHDRDSPNGRMGWV